MSDTSVDAPAEKLWDPTKYATTKDEIRALRYYKRREADSVGRRIARGGDPRAVREHISIGNVEKRYEELERSESGEKLIKEVIAEEEAVEASNQKLMRISWPTTKSEALDEEKM